MVIIKKCDRKSEKNLKLLYKKMNADVNGNVYKNITDSYKLHNKL